MVVDNFFEKFKSDVSNLDPVVWCEKYLTLDGKPFRINGNGYKPFSDIYRYMGVKSLEKSSKPLIIVAGRQVGKTTLISALSAFFTCSGIAGNNGRPPMSLIHFFPTLIHAFAYAKGKLNPLISNSIQIEVGKKKIPYIESCLDKSSPTNDSLQFKQFIGSNVLRIESTGLDASRIRGITATLCAFDECQMISAQAISNANKVLTTSVYGPRGIEIYLGTPLQKGSNYWRMWNASSQQYYQLGCEQCKEYFPLYIPGSPDHWEKVWLYGYVVKCTKCGCEQNKLEAQERGKWIALNKDDSCYYTGYHINQLYMPFFSKEDIIKEKPENHPVNTERAYMNEVLGEFYSGEAGPITAEEIHDKCADLGRKFRASISPAENKNTYAGFDWGKKSENSGQQGQSYSSTVLLSDDGKGLLSVEFFTLLKRNDFEEKKSIVDQMFRQYSVKLAVGDVGYANDLTEVLQRSHGDKFLASQASAHVNNHIKYSDDIFPKVIIFEKDYYIAELYDLLKRGMIRFPYGDYEKITPLIQHICSMETKTITNRVGDAQQRYVKGSGPNDAFMALINAYLAYKFDITKGFKEQKAGLFNQGGSNKILASLAYAPKR